ncbi:hypothetical protein A3715_04785 [Oleiphilus sp. HI0009]|uniref:DUF4381 domain-containing protein n=2 Tax=Oleiphilus TaxID=141450 RepID=UPI0007C31725|nr:MULTISPECIES: DUF4381 domain-containing protein [unclassified Oleiphilus]KZX83419.1 hypothetical protein A3715_04785 [Oleiphilus sp. HI0009]KZY69833.1 hypothetical protein A3739_07785 [Oleiphilus sp. HI0067]KZY72295.1 hypothetical protein A3738_00020 [Oleiphilus sp. HI0066]
MNELPIHDIITQPAISWWPPSIGWWVLAALLITLIFVTVRFIFVRHRNNQWKRVALAKFETLKSQESQTVQLNQDIQILLKQVISYVEKDSSIKSRHGAEWENCLSSHIPLLDQAALDALGDGNYRASPNRIDEQALEDIERWLRKIKC